MPKIKNTELTQQVRERIASSIEKISGGSWKKFAHEAGIGPSTLQAINEGKTLPGAETLIRIAKHGGVSIDWLLTGKEPQGGEAEPQAHPPIDVDRLADVLLGIRACLSEKGVVLPPEKEARLVALVYDLVAGIEEEDETRRIIERLVDLAG